MSYSRSSRSSYSSSSYRYGSSTEGHHEESSSRYSSTRANSRISSSSYSSSITSTAGDSSSLTGRTNRTSLRYTDSSVSSYSTRDDDPPVSSIGYSPTEVDSHYVAISDYSDVRNKDSIDLLEGQIVEVVDSSAENRWKVRTTGSRNTPEQGWVSSHYLERKSSLTPVEARLGRVISSHDTEERYREAKQNRNKAIKDLFETEKEFVKDMKYVDSYLEEFESAPTELKDLKDDIFSNFKEITEFHDNVLVKGIEENTNEPSKLGKTLLRLERDFDKHAKYCQNEPQAQELISKLPTKRLLQDMSDKLHDDKTLSERLKLPIQRINEYQVTLKDLVKNTAIMHDSTADLERALDFMSTVSQSSPEVKLVQSIEGIHGSIRNIGPMLKHGWLTITDNDNKAAERYAFLFKGRLFITEKKNITEDQVKHITKEIVKLPDVEIVDDGPKTIKLVDSDKSRSNYPMKLEAKTISEKESWMEYLTAKESATESNVEDEPQVVKVEEPETESKEDVISEHEQIITSTKAEEVAESPETGGGGEDGDAHQLMKEPVPPTIIADLTDTEVSIGGSAMLELKVNGFPKPQITWYKDGEEIKAGGRFRFLFEDQESSALIIRNAEIEDTGTYTVLARNNLGEVTTCGELLVKSPPSFKKKMHDMSVMTNEPIKFEVEIEGKPTPEVKWYKDGQQLSESERVKMLNETDELFAMVIDKAQLEDSGSYSCQASNDSGDVSGFGNLTVNAPPSFVRDLKDVNASKGDNVTFEAKISGNPKPKISWKKDGEEIKSDNKHIKIIEEDSTTHILSINKVTESDVGEYSCCLSNEYGDATGAAKLNIQSKPIFTKEMEDKEARENEEVKFEVKTEGTPSPKIKWYVEDTEIHESSQYKIDSDDENGTHSLIVTKVTSEVTGKYTCKVVNSLGESSSSGSLNMISEPKFKKPLEDQTVCAGETLKLSVTIAGTPTPNVKWKRNGEDVSVDAHIRISKEGSDTYTLEMESVTIQAAGEYECTATNDFGSSSSSCTISVSTKAGFDQKFKDKNVSETENVEFTVKIHGDPKPDVTWKKDGEKVVEDERIEIIIEDDFYILIIKGCVTSDSGTYSCEVHNKYGGEEVSAQLTVTATGDEVKPYFTKRLKDTTVFKGDSVTFEVQIGGAPTPDVTWYKDNVEITESTRVVKTKNDEDGSYTLKLSESEPDDSASYSCKASNKYGEDYAEASLTVKIPSEPIITGGEEITITEDEDIHIKMNISGDPYPEILWFKDHEEIKSSDTVTITKIIEQEESEVIILSGKKSDEGDYECIASNRFGTTSKKSSVTVKSKDGEQEEKQKPKFVNNPTPASCIFGDAAKFEAKVSGTPKPMVKWFHGEEEDELASSDRIILNHNKEDGEFSVVLKECTFEDAGNYTCMAINTYGYASADAQLTVKEPIEPNVSGLKDKKVETGDKVKFEVEVDGSPKPIVKWFKDDHPLIESDHVEMVSDPSSNKYQLIISGVKDADIAKYAVVASNVAGKASEQASLSFIDSGESEVDKGKEGTRAPTITQALPKNVDISEGEPLILEAKFDGEPSPDIKWLKNGNELVPDNHMTMSVDPDGSAKLVIESAKPEDSGKYAIEAVNDSGTKMTKTDASVEPKRAEIISEGDEPVMKKQLQPTELTEGQPGEIKAEVAGSPMPSIQWMKDGNEVTPDRRIHVEETPDGAVALVFDKVRPKDAGEYKLIAKNDAGEVSSEAPVTVLPKPEEPDFIKKLKPTELKEGSPGKLEAILTGVPTPEAKWTKDGDTIEPDDRVQLETLPDGKVALKFNEVKPEDAGKYELIASNEAGSIKSSAPVTVAPKVEEPSFLRGLQATNLKEGEPGRIEAEVAGLPKPNIKWTKDGSPVLPSDRIKMEHKDDGTVALVFDEVKPDDEGIYKIVASNDEGRASTSAPISVEPGLKKPSVDFAAELKPTQLQEGEKGRIEAAITGQPKDISWFKDNEKIAPCDHINTEESLDGKIALNIDKVVLDDAGEYKATLKDDSGEKSSTAPVTVVPKDVKVEPNFSDELKPTELTEGEPGLLKAVLTGNPVPEVKWMKDGENIKPSTHMKPDLKQNGEVMLAIDKVKPADAGEYVIVAENDLGDASSGAPITVIPKDKPKKADAEEVKKPEAASIEEKPTITEGLKPVELLAGKPGEMSVKVDGTPKPSVKWLKDGEEIKPSSRVTMEEKPDGTRALKFKDVKPEDAGEYSVKAENDLGDTSSSAPVTVTPKDELKKPGVEDVKKPETAAVEETGERPTVTEGLKPVELLAGKPAELSIKVAGAPKPSVKWLKDGKEVHPSSRVTMEERPDGTCALKFKDVRPEDAGKYEAVVSNDKGKDSSSADVSVVEPPTFIRPLLPCNIKDDYPCSLRAKVSTPLPDIKWFKDGNLVVPKGDHIKISAMPDGSVELKIDHISADDEGTYKCVASNSAGEVESKAEVKVEVEPKGNTPSIIEGLSPQDWVQGEPGKFIAKVDGEPKPKVKWYKDGKELKNSDRIHMNEEPDGTVSLTIDDVNPDDKGNYELNVANKNGEVKSTAPVSVSGPPKFVEPLSSEDVVDGDMARLECKVSAYPPADIAWQKDGKDITPDGIHIQSTRRPDGTIALLIDKCKPEDVGRYTCVAKNSGGEASSSGDLKVTNRKKSDKPESIPMILTPLRDLAVKEGEPFSFETRVSGNPLPEVKWTLDNQAIVPSDNIILTFDGKRACLRVKSSNPQHKGTYKIKLVNALGDVESSAQAKVAARSAPVFVEKLVDTEVKIGEVAELVCKVEGEPEPAVMWYFDNYALSPGYKYDIKRDGESCLLLIKHPRPQKDSGRYECRAKNEMGEDKTSCRLKIMDHEERGEAPIFLKKIGNCEVLEGMTAKFTACISGCPEPDVKWFRNGEQIESGEFVKIEMDHHGLHRLIIKKAGEQDAGEYRCSTSNIHGSAQCTAKLTYESLEDLRRERPVPMVIPEPMDRPTDKLPEKQKFKDKGIPSPLANAPFIFHMMDDYVSLAWKPSVPYYPRVPVTYAIEMCKLPDGEWRQYKSGIKDSCADVRGLEPNKDYKFRIRVENKFGISDPSPYTTAYRSKVQLPSPTPKAPRDYEIEHESPDKMAAAPRFVRKEEDVMYGIKNHPVSIEFWVYGCPQPECTWYFNGDKLEMGVQYDQVQDRNGRVTLYIVRMKEENVGNFMCVAVNEHGEARQKIKLCIAEPPMFTKRLQETTVMIRKSGKLECRITGDPTPTIKWFKDWHPMSESNRIKLTFTEPDLYTLQLSDAIAKDAGLYSCSAVNLAGHASSSAHITIEESEDQYDLLTYRRPYIVKPRSRPVEDSYDIGDEIGRGTQGIIYHAVKRDTGKSYAAKTMRGKDKFREWMDNEMDIMNQLNHPKLVRFHDAYTTDNSLSLITEFCGGGELLNSIISKGSIAESDIAHYVRQILEGLQHMHNKRIGHLGLSIGDVLVSKVHGDLIKVGDFGLAARLPSGKEFLQEYGHPEFVAPEIANKKPATFASDIWSVGIISYILLSGISPFLGENDRETLSRVQDGKIDLYEPLAEVSDDARDFLSKLLTFDPADRTDVGTALKHPWLSIGDIPGRGEKLSNIDRLKDYQQKWRKWYENANCRHHYRRRKLSSCFTHPSKMIYPPGEVYTPSPSPPPTLDRRPKYKPSAFDVTYKQRIVDEPENFVSESNYQSGPDTYLLQYRDPDYALRVRQYLRVGAARSPNLAAHLREGYWGGNTRPQVAVRERRRFTDVMDEEIDDEQKGFNAKSLPFRLQKEVGSLGYTHGQMLSVKKEALEQLNRPPAVEGMPPYFREKLKDQTAQEEDELTFSCMVSSATKPVCTWFRNDGILIQSQRIKIEEKENGYWELKLCPVKVYDAGVYKCVARNEFGFTVSKSRLYLGLTPGRPDPPEAEQSDESQIYVAWSPPKLTGNSPILCYKLEYKLPGEMDYAVVEEKVDHEFFVVHKLKPESPYQFRVTANNKFGWGEPSCPSEELKTNVTGSPSVKITKARKYQQQMTETGRNMAEDLYEAEKLDYSIETNPIPLKDSPPLDLFNFIAEIASGRFSIVLKTFAKEDKKYYAAKLIQTTAETEARVREEYKILSTLRHERIASLHDACFCDGMMVLAMEKLSGHDIMTYLTFHHQYTEENVCKIIIQVLDALQYLHFRNIGYFNLQPDNVVVVNPKNLNIKLVDFGSAQKFGDVVLVNYDRGDEEYIAPEIIKREDVGSPADVWTVGVLTYILLSGVSPFQGVNNEETISNVTYVRYRFEYLYKEATQETTRFLMHIFKRTPSKRPTIEECLEHKWITPSEFMLRKREKAIFSSSRLSQFAEDFHESRKKATPDKLKNAFGMSLSRSISIDMDTYDEF